MKKIIVQFNFSGATQQQYDQVWDDLRAKGYEHPKGLLHHVSTFEGDNLIVVDVWESEELFSKFKDALMPILEENDFPKAQPKISPVYYEYVGEDVHATV